MLFFWILFFLFLSPTRLTNDLLLMRVREPSSFGPGELPFLCMVSVIIIMIIFKRDGPNKFNDLVALLSPPPPPRYIRLSCSFSLFPSLATTTTRDLI